MKNTFTIFSCLVLPLLIGAKPSNTTPGFPGNSSKRPMYSLYAQAKSNYFGNSIFAFNKPDNSSENNLYVDLRTNAFNPSGEYIKHESSDDIKINPDISVVENKNSSIEAKTNKPFSTGSIVVSGMIWDDANGNLFLSSGEGLIDGSNTTTGITTGAPLYLNLIDAATNLVIASVPLQSYGTYTFPSVPANSTGLLIQLTKNQGIPGVAKPAIQLPAGWINTGENKYGRAGGDDTIPDGQIQLVTGSINITSMDFGIEKLPEAVAQSYVIPTPVYNSIITLNGVGSNAAPAPLTGEDYEDGDLGEGNTFVITSVAGMEGHKLLYNDVEITGYTTIANFNPSKLKVQFTGLFSKVFSFKYRAKDFAGKTDSTDAYYIVLWASILAVQKLEMSATVSGNTVNIKWITENEFNTKTCFVERSTTADFAVISEQHAAGNYAGTKIYSAEDNLLQFQPGAVIYYRIKIIDGEGKATYSNTVAIKITSKLSPFVWPNPFTNVIKISFQSSFTTTAMISLMDVQGKTVYQYKTPVLKGSNWVRLNNVSMLPKGIYILMINDANKEIHFTQKIEKL